MENFVTVKTFTYPHEVAIIRGRLESEGIECFVQDELTIQVNNFYSNALGGVKLQVREGDVPEAIKILKEGGYLTEEDFQTSPFQAKLDKLVAKISKSKTLVLLIVAAILFIAPLFYYAFN